VLLKKDEIRIFNIMQYVDEFCYQDIS